MDQCGRILEEKSVRCDVHGERRKKRGEKERKERVAKVKYL